MPTQGKGDCLSWEYPPSFPRGGTSHWRLASPWRSSRFSPWIDSAAFGEADHGGRHRGQGRVHSASWARTSKRGSGGAISDVLQLLFVLALFSPEKLDIISTSPIVSCGHSAFVFVRQSTEVFGRIYCVFHVIVVPGS